MGMRMAVVVMAVICVLCLQAVFAVQAHADVNKGAVMTTNAYLREAPDVSTKLLKKLHYGDKVKIVKLEGDWYKVKKGKIKGYIAAWRLVAYDKSKKHIALTFDDGPSTATTNTVLKALKQTKCRATFFVLGSMINKSSGKLLKKAVKLGCEIGNHSYSHPFFTNKSNATIKSEIKRTNKKVKKYTGTKVKLVRCPYGDGAFSSRVLKAIGLPNIYWSIDTEDWRYRSTSRLISYMKSHRGDGEIVLMHDIHSSTVKAIKTICKNLKSAGYETVTVSELAAIKGVKLKKGKNYLSF